jgi:prepilin-type N-terminal cleavage/methylation domain-containing protein
MRKQKLGFTLIEVLVSFAIFVLILLFFGKVQLVAWQANQFAYSLFVATQQIINIQERLHALGDAEGLTEQVRIWEQENQKVLSGSKGSVSGYFPNYETQLCWGVGAGLVPARSCVKSQGGHKARPYVSGLMPVRISPNA